MIKINNDADYPSDLLCYIKNNYHYDPKSGQIWILQKDKCKMAQNLNIKRCWWHSGASYAHYDIPKRRIAEIQSKCHVVSSRTILKIVKGESIAEDEDCSN